MKALYLWLNLLVGLCVRSSFAFPPEGYTQHASFPRPQLTGSSKHPEQQKAPAEEREQVNTVRVTCHPDTVEIVIKADMFGVGAPVNMAELRLGVEHNDHCGATASSRDEYRIIVRLVDCGTKHWMTEDSLVYTNLLIYSPEASPDGVVRMDEAVIPIECHYERKYSLSSSSLLPTWIPFTSTQTAVETLQFSLRLMTDDWLYERSSNVYFLGEPIGMEASVRVGHHMKLRVFVSSCVATLNPDIYSVPRYVFVENGCLGDSQLPGSTSHFFRQQDDALRLVIDAFRFHDEERGELYITCHLQAVPVDDAEAPDKACTFVNGRWRSADGNDYLCGYCRSQNEADQTPSKPSSPDKFSPRGFGKPDEPEPLWRSGLRANTVWEQEMRLGPMMVLPVRQKSGPIPVEELPPVLNKISRPSLYGSRWRSGINDRIDHKKEPLPDSPSTPDHEEDQTSTSEQNKDVISEMDLEDEDAEMVPPPLEKVPPPLEKVPPPLEKVPPPLEKVPPPLEKVSPELRLKSKAAVLNINITAAFDDDDDVSLTAPLTVDVTKVSNETATQSDLPDKTDPKR